MDTIFTGTWAHPPIVAPKTIPAVCMYIYRYVYTHTHTHLKKLLSKILDSVLKRKVAFLPYKPLSVMNDQRLLGSRL